MAGALWEGSCSGWRRPGNDGMEEGSGPTREGALLSRGRVGSRGWRGFQGRLRGAVGRHPPQGCCLWCPGETFPWDTQDGSLGRGKEKGGGEKPTATGVLALGVSSPEGLVSALQESRRPGQGLPPPWSPLGCTALSLPSCPVRAHLGVSGDRGPGIGWRWEPGSATLWHRQAQSDARCTEAGPQAASWGAVVGG